MKSYLEGFRADSNSGIHLSISAWLHCTLFSDSSKSNIVIGCFEIIHVPHLIPQIPFLDASMHMFVRASPLGLLSKLVNVEDVMYVSTANDKGDRSHGSPPHTRSFGSGVTYSTSVH
ncbi:hypothetical protein F2Q70_00041656 [Brassica cretica]|uniref:Uncharacterized protein n=1 Tax=Brassica cretica TaxID=69181 RepID=A0A8S9K1U4_BRACR|nr:hypothetical protein F2Q70_00041656 [Brassica cretica]